MKRKDFILGMNSALEELNAHKGKYFTCELVSLQLGLIAGEHYKSFLHEAGISRTNTINLQFFDDGWLGISAEQQLQTYSMRIFALAVFMAWALKTKAYREW